MNVREKVADRLRYFDECGPGPVSRGEYLEDADELVTLVIADVVEWLRTPTSNQTRTSRAVIDAVADELDDRYRSGATTAALGEREAHDA